MKTLKHLCAALTLISALSGFVLADGHIETAPKPADQTMTTHGESGTNEEQTTDTMTEVTLDILRNLLSLL